MGRPLYFPFNTPVTQRFLATGKTEVGLRQDHHAPAGVADSAEKVLRGAEAQPEDILALHRFQVVEEGEVGVRVVGEVRFRVRVEPEHSDQVRVAVNQVVDQRGNGLSGMYAVIK